MSKDLNNNLETLFSKMENFITSKTVVGDPISVGDTLILPLVDVAFGVGAASMDKPTEAEKQKEVDTGGLGAKITPSAVLVVKGDSVQLVNVKNQDSLNKIIDMAPSIIAKIQGFFEKNKEDEETEIEEE